MSLLVPFLCAVLLIGAQAQVYFNSSYDCSQGCLITDPAIYIGNMLPTANQEVFFNVTQQEASFILPSNNTYNVTGLHIWNTVLTIGDYATLSVGEELYFYQIYLQLNATGALVGHHGEDEETEAYFEGSTIVSFGHISIHKAEFFQCAVFSVNGSILHFDEFEFENGTIEVDQGSNFNATDESEFSFSIITFYITPYLGDVEFESVNASFPYGFYAEGQFLISSSNFSAYFPDALANVSFVLAGQNNLYISNLHFNSDKIKINSTGTPNITFNVNNNASFDGNLTVPGQIVVSSGSTVNFNGTIRLSGGLNADVDSFTQIRATGSLSCGGPISLVGHQNESNSFSVNNANITAPTVKLEKFTLYSYAGITVINGSVVNNGSLHIFESSSVIVQGNYTQYPNTTFGAYNLDNTKNRRTNLVVTGSAHIDGNVKFNTSETKKEFTATVIKATQGVNGSFATHEFFGDDTQYKNVLFYSHDSVLITINPNNKTPSWQGLHWWVWVLIGVGALIVFVTIVVIVRVRRNRSKYETVGSTY